ncbi:GSU2403 family nucleotidyltransferase fold protein [Zhaonella formicivorans]|uniref:GSU2403 family nucleotidyltransferase fold protein n=1 Tax=Zhaonella formicivorans TaxID=2528593 RepID=UPI0010D352FD|nr:GSU2403 family nucleotidyltransferase fold protein [Zhaonella formicivorans]
MDEQKRVFWDTMKLFKEIGLLPHVLLIGSWVEYVYEFAYYKDYYSNLRTRDLDFLVKNINRPSNPIDIKQALTNNGYIMDVDSLTGTTKFFKENLLELEFLVMEKGRGQSEPYLIKPLNIRAEGLRHLDILLNNTTQVSIDEYGMMLQIPLPQAYLLHKIIISDKRSDFKREKDLRSILNILEYMKQYPQELHTLSYIYQNRLLKSEQAKVFKYCNEYNIDLGFDLSRVNNNILIKDAVKRNFEMER